MTIVKSRGTKHSNQVRELVLSSEGVTLADVYTSGGEVLMGTLRWEREEADRQDKERKRIEAERERIELDLAESEINAKMLALKKQLEANRAEMARLSNEEENRRIGEERTLVDLQKLRSADASEGM